MARVIEYYKPQRGSILFGTNLLPTTISNRNTIERLKNVLISETRMGSASITIFLSLVRLASPIWRRFIHLRSRTYPVVRQQSTQTVFGCCDLVERSTTKRNTETLSNNAHWLNTVAKTPCQWRPFQFQSCMCCVGGHVDTTSSTIDRLRSLLHEIVFVLIGPSLTMEGTGGGVHIASPPPHAGLYCLPVHDFMTTRTYFQTMSPSYPRRPAPLPRPSALDIVKTRQIAQSLRTNGSLRLLDISFNNLKPRSAMVLANALLDNA